eukprot:Plantae.Rhodophyta-Palmaria_palmata.ctg9865.p1 GENE.Plantae.Rhodophyta-Palmaria_palmata.ctg9865~~Plantae.Rhodophyta-Palmaria_palmata.ctg9865.p1  ORF type:complete len:207 (-),score=0.73 Plantae.Rhodophyta-Palmaria_palmata.ctg9865:240-860(-)
MAVILDRAQRLVCVGLMIALAVMLEEDLDCFQNPKNPKERAACVIAHRSFQDVKSEHWTLVKMFLAFKQQSEENLDNACGLRWCQDNRLVFIKLREALRAFDRLRVSCRQFKWGVNEDQLLRPWLAYRTHRLKALVRGHFMQIAYRRTDFSRESYSTVCENLPIALHYTSQVKIRDCEAWLLYISIFFRKFVYQISCCSVVEPELL